MKPNAFHIHWPKEALTTDKRGVIRTPRIDTIIANQSLLTV